MNMLPVNRPDVLIGIAHEKFDAAGRLTDEPTRTFLAALMGGLLQWARRLAPDSGHHETARVVETT